MNSQPLEMARNLLNWHPSLGWIGTGMRPPHWFTRGRGFCARVRAVVGVLFFLGLLSGGVQSAASAPGDQDAPTAGSVRMDVRAGFDGAGRVGGGVPLDVPLVNEGSELKAQVEVVVDQPGGRSTYSYRPTPFSLPVLLPRLRNPPFTLEVNPPHPPTHP